MTSITPEYSTSFDTLRADGSTNKGDVPAEYEFNSERHRAYVTPDGGSRTRIVNRTDLNGASDLTKLSSTSKFNDLNKGFELNPSAGDIVEYGSAERYRYVPGYGFQFGVLTVLQNAGDALRAGQELIVRFGTADNNYRVRFRADADHEVGLVKASSAVDDSTVTQSDWREDPFGTEGASLSRPLMTRPDFVHYGGGEYRPKLAYLNSDVRQENTTITRTGNRDEIATEEVNGFVRVIYDCSDSSSGGTCVVGDIQTQVEGQVKEVDRTPPHRIRDQGTGTNFTADTWEVVALGRKDPDRQNVSVDIESLRLVPQSAAELAVITVPKETISWPSSDDWFTPGPSDPPNTVIEWAVPDSGDRTDYPSRTLNPPNVASEDLIEGAALAHLESRDTTQGNSVAATETTVEKAKLHEDEYAVYAVRFDGTGGSITALKDSAREDF